VFPRNPKEKKRDSAEDRWNGIRGEWGIGL